MKSPPLNAFTRAELEAALARYENEKVSTHSTCRECGKEFLRDRRWQEFCCAKHRTAWHAHQKDRMIERQDAIIQQLRREVDELRIALARAPRPPDEG